MLGTTSSRQPKLGVGREIRASSWYFPDRVRRCCPFELAIAHQTKIVVAWSDPLESACIGQLCHPDFTGWPCLVGCAWADNFGRVLVCWHVTPALVSGFSVGCDVLSVSSSGFRPPTWRTSDDFANIGQFFDHRWCSSSGACLNRQRMQNDRENRKESEAVTDSCPIRNVSFLFA